MFIHYVVVKCVAGWLFTRGKFSWLVFGGGREFTWKSFGELGVALEFETACPPFHWQRSPGAVKQLNVLEFHNIFSRPGQCLSVA